MPCRTLIVEDDPVSARTLLSLVTLLGHEAVIAKTLAEALRKLDQFAPECVLVDLMLPDGSGVAVVERIRERGLLVKVGVISALAAGQPYFDAVVPLRPDAVFRKPLQIEEVHGWLSAQDWSSSADHGKS